MHRTILLFALSPAAQLMPAAGAALADLAIAAARRLHSGSSPISTR